MESSFGLSNLIQRNNLSCSETKSKKDFGLQFSALLDKVMPRLYKHREVSIVS